MKEKVYISGKISGIEKEAFLLFENAENELIKSGFEPINPMKLPHNHDKSWHSYMKEDIIALCQCDRVIMLPNWKDSKGAIIENLIATMISIPIFYANETI